ncbi:hypothetical protein [Cellulomonas chengniuliangii]|uniref:Uncharacterized protein n=1 Tax=Cellulomonas chengniuliangii TaxID=2968084 RepID=A0ABY5KZY6_9CELL|nr:hypothetical protein [Cellulomonas chengniuliangii]MCC2307858.1 hypothetical protein [Cellulomonas chengniuliangii]MCC2318375.1 hypothetical protein [Cellulomonas chengniuliangii]UUI75388.1 hypothetical protein NP064_00185 [Cellulomonas chengniuliangii]
MPSTDSRRRAGRAALFAGTGAAVLVAVLVGALALAQRGSTDDADATPAPTSSVPARTDASASPPVASPSATWPADVSEADLRTSLGTVSAVWLGVWPDEGSAPALPSEAELAERGYEPSPIPVACLDGSVEQLGLDPARDFWGWPLYFRAAEDAQAFTELWGQPVEGVTEGSIACDWG